MTTKVDITKADGTPVTEGEIHHVFIDPATYSKRPIPDYMRAALEPYLVDAQTEAPA
jgi:acyl-CoA thioesterase FadM